MVLLGIILSATTTLTLSATRATSDQQATQQAQTAAESGVAFASAKIQQARALLATLEVPQGTHADVIRSLLAQYCGVTALAAAPEVISTPVLACTADPIVTTANRLDIFKTYVPVGQYSSVDVASTSIDAYWATLFGLNAPQTTSTVGSTTRYSTNFHLIPTRVLQTGEASYQVMFRSDSFESTGELVSTDTAVASREVSVAQSAEMYIIIQRPAFNAFAQFRDKTTSATGGGQLSFGDGEEFNGPVHTNGQPGFIGTPKFYSKFTSAASTAVFSGASTSCNTVLKLTAGNCTASFPNYAPKFSQPEIELPTNNNNQLRASFGGDAANADAVTAAEVRSAWGVTSMTDNTVYFSKSTGSTATPNTGTAWIGGLYINGDANIKFALTIDNRQRIEITQGTVLTVFEKQLSGNWTAKVGSAATRTLSGNFNGLIYSTGNLNVSGNGDNAAADIASDTQITLTNSGIDKNIYLKDSVTYQDNPLTNPSATNVLGIYSGGGSVLLDGVNNKDLIMNASILATREGEGFGSVNAGTQRYTAGFTQPRVILTGGVIESQSQTVSSGNGGYKRNYSYDSRFNTGFSPPYFPLQQRWTSEVDSSAVKFGFWRQSQ